LGSATLKLALLSDYVAGSLFNPYIALAL
jgi:hypothetical protein